MYEFFQSLGQSIVNAIVSIFTWLGNLLKDIFNGLKHFVAELFKPLILFFQGLWYLITKCFDIIVLVVQVVFGLFKVVGSIIAGIFHTFASMLGFTGSTDYYYMPDAYHEGYYGVAGFLNKTGLNTIALIMMAFLWILTAYAIIKIAGGER